MLYLFCIAQRLSFVTALSTAASRQRKSPSAETSYDSFGALDNNKRNALHNIFTLTDSTTLHYEECMENIELFVSFTRSHKHCQTYIFIKSYDKIQFPHFGVQDTKHLYTGWRAHSQLCYWLTCTAVHIK